MVQPNTVSKSLESTVDNQQRITRRQILVGLLASVGAVSFSGNALALNTLLDTPQNITSKTALFYTPKEFMLISRVADLIIPTTDTKGAIGVGVPASMDRLYTEWTDESSKQTHRKQVQILNRELDKLAKGDFLSLDHAKQTTALQSLDNKAFSDTVGDLHAYREIKNTIARFYYLSEEGATKELRYEAVPGRWEGCIDFTEVGKTWAV